MKNPFNLSEKRGIALIVCTVLTVAILALGCHIDKRDRQTKQQEIAYSDSYYGKFTMEDINILQRWVLDHEDYEFRESNDFKTNPLALTDEWGHILQFNSKEECYQYALQKLNTTVTYGEVSEHLDNKNTREYAIILANALGRNTIDDLALDSYRGYSNY